jgi:aminocarboxymuconate-semialdehyde decarboxylase
MMIRGIDVHAHILPEATIGALTRASPRVAPHLIRQENGAYIMRINGRVVQNPMPPEMWDVGLRLVDMDRNRVDAQLVCPNVQTFFYGEDAGLGAECAAIQNEGIAALVKAHPGRFLGLGTLPLQDPRRAAEELRRIMRDLGLYGVQIGSNVNDRNLDDPALEPVWEAANELRAFILVHPHGSIVPGNRLASYSMRNFVGLPFETTMAGASLVFGGVLERYPDMIVCLCHAGGFVPYQAGRFVHAWNVRPEAKLRLRETAEASLGRLHFDTITHSPRALRFLVESVGADRVLLGSDYPFDMGNLDCVARVEAAGLSDGDCAKILGGRVRQLLRLG